MARNEAKGSYQHWFSVLCLFMDWFLWAGLIKTLGVMLPTLQEQFVAQAWLIGWMIAVVDGVIKIAGIFTRPLEVMLGTRALVTVSGFMVGASIIVASFTTNVVMLTVTLALIAGPGLNFINITTRGVIGRCFTTNYATASGIGFSGLAFALIVVGPFTQLLLDTYGWRGALLILGGFSLHLGVCGALLRSPSTDETQTNATYQQVSPGADDEETDKTKQSRLRSFKDALSAQMKHFGFSVFFKVSFWIPTVVFTIDHFVNNQWLLFYVSQAQAKGFSAYDAVTFTTAAGVGNLFFKIFAGPIIDRGLLKLRPGIIMMIVVCSFALLITPWVDLYWLMIVNAFVFFGASGILSVMSDLYTRELLGVELLACAFSWMNLIGAMLNFCLGFIPGWIYDQTGSYDFAFFILGCITALSLMALMLEWIHARFKTRHSNST
ncbi:monocarboxylate transporter 13-like [Patiria miniata]|uniref:Major facilitator superfamily (MFS) profile domain-containing protein n=1 Tax=Patiria miniata TaxID=46514 RepID=A0A914B6B2_PATMI|nr:monocarboxylate transporter 13-like [Patiria miniata]